MDSMSAFAMGEASRGREMKVFDWDKAAQLIAENRSSVASAGLSGDWGYTGGTIYENGSIVEQDDTYVYLASTWATPELDLDGDVIDCFVMESDTEWDQHTFWPDSARKLLDD